MPNFENLEKYESSSKRSSNQRMIPIAPHSMQAVDYRPRRNPAQQRPKPKKSGNDFKPVEFEPVSIPQMEKEYRQAGRSISHNRPRKPILKSLAKLLDKLKKLLGLKEKKKNKRGQKGRQRARKGRSDGTHKRPAENSSPGNNQGTSSGKKRRNRNRRPQNQSDGQPAPSKEHQGSPKAQADASNEKGQRRSNRSRRGRQRPRGQQSNKDQSSQENR